jgi:DNA-directed RNA polymerase subunit RPC12/RpoP
VSAESEGQVACYRCGSATILAGQIQPLGREPGSQIYRCTACGELTWTPLLGGARHGAVTRNQPMQQQQQQQQGDPEPDKS